MMETTTNTDQPTTWSAGPVQPATPPQEGPRRSPNPFRSVVKPGQRVIVHERAGVIVKVTSTALLVEFHHKQWSISREHEADAVLEEVPSSNLQGAAGTHSFLMDPASAQRLATYRKHDFTQLMARLQVVSLMLTGCLSGSAHLAEPWEPHPGLRTADNTSLNDRAKIVSSLLTNRDNDWVLTLLLGLNKKTSRNDPNDVDHSAPDPQKVRRWERSARTQGIFSLVDERGRQRAPDSLDVRKRKTTEDLVEQVLGSRDYKRDSRKSVSHYRREVQALAATKDCLILHTSKLDELITQRLKDLGRTPTQVKTALMRASIAGSQSHRPTNVGQEVAFDAAVADNFVVGRPGTEPFRPFISIASDVATGVITGLHLSGRYTAMETSMLFYEAFRSVIILTDAEGLPAAHLKSIPSLIYAPAEILKPGCIPATLRADNASVNFAHMCLAIARQFGCDIHPSRVNMSLDNAPAETRFRQLSPFYNAQPGYTGENTSHRAKWAHGVKDLMSFDEYERAMHKEVFGKLNHAPTTVGHLKATGITRMQHWDLLVEEINEVETITDPTALFQFWPRATVTRTHKGLHHKTHRFTDKVLWSPELKHLIGPDRQVTIAYDPRRSDHIVIPDPHNGVVHEVPNVLNEVMRAPLTRHITALARRRLPNIDLAGHQGRRQFARTAESLLEHTDTRMTRDLISWRSSLVDLLGAVADGADFIPGSDSAVPNYAHPHDAAPAARPTSRHSTGPGTTAGNRPADGARITALDFRTGTSAETDDTNDTNVWDRPLPLPENLQ